MGLLSNYWEMLRLDPRSGGYEKKAISPASAFFQGQFSTLEPHTPLTMAQHQAVQRLLLTIFQRRGATAELLVLAEAGLCLRCYVSHGILVACRQLASVFSAAKAFTYQDLLPFVLDDDGMTYIILNPAGQTQLCLDPTGQMTPLAYARFTVEVLRRFDPNAQGSLNLNSWVHYQTRQQPEIKRFLSERGFSFLTDWALLNQVRKRQWENFNDRDRALIKAFHQVYRRDRRQQGQRQHGKCPDPTLAQLQEMVDWLATQHIAVSSPEQLRRDLRRIAKALRQLDIWQRRGMPVWDSLDRGNEAGDDRLQALPDLKEINTVEAIAWREIQTQWQAQMPQCLEQGVVAGLKDYINHLQKRPRYRTLAAKVVPALRLIYREGKSQSEVADLLALTNQSQVSRLLDLKDLLSRVRDSTVAQVLNLLHPSLDADRCATDPDYLSTVAQKIEQFVDEEILMAGDSNTRLSNRRMMENLYRRYLQRYLEGCHEPHHI